MFGAGGGTSSYREIEETDVILLWGSNARETHPIFFHHLLKGVHNGARLFVVDPRRTSSAQWADRWLGLDVGSDIALSNTMAREIIHAGLHNRSFIEHATTGFDEYAASVEAFTLEEGERLTGVPAEAIREAAHAFARADRAMICWTLGITEHHNAVDNVLSLINLALLCGHVGRFGSGLNPLRGQNNVQGGGDMGAIPNKLPGFQDIERDHEARARFEAAWGTTIRPTYGWHLTQMFHGMERGELRTPVRDRREPGAVRGRHQPDARAARGARLPDRAGHRPHEDRRVRRRRLPLVGLVVRGRGHGDELASGGCSACARRSSRRARRATTPGSSRSSRAGSGSTGAEPTAEQIWDELRSLSPMHAGMRYDRLEALGGIQWPCPDEEHPGSPILHERLWAEPLGGPPAPFSVVEDRPPFESLDDEYPIRLTTGRRLESYNTGAQTNLYSSPLHRASRCAFRRRMPSGCSSRRARSCASRAVAARSRRPCASTPRCVRGSRS